MTRTLAALALVVAALAAVAALLMPSPAAGATGPAPAPEAALAHDSRTAHGTGVGPDLPVLAAAAPAGELTPAQATEVLYAADRVCEGIVAGVPEGFLVRTAAEEGGLTLTDAHAFVEAAITRCPLR